MTHTALDEVLRTTFRLVAFRPHQEEACREAAAGHDVLLVMPTGAGKSLCYQLPGVARGGTTLVVSPLIALMEDQVAKLRALGLAADRIHSGRDRADSRAALGEYLAGTLAFLFVAPERLAVPGFPETLAKRKPTLIAVDEAHCISDWGHDFRPEYRLLGRRLPSLRPAPVIALTATATPRVQKDIAQQLGLAGPPKVLIHGFRRDNLAIEAAELNPGGRPAVATRVLAGPDRLPAILYSPTRKAADELAASLDGPIRVRAYHAGLSSKSRDEVQTAFLAGELDAVVATIAFGMGVDKADVRTVIHMAQPSSVEAYYQEIGRAGRDGKPARALLLHAYIDRRTHEFFIDRDYPPPSELSRVLDALEDSPTDAVALGRALGLSAEDLDRRLERLVAIGAIEISPEGVATRIEADWRGPYDARRAHRLSQLEEMSRLARATSCRMTAIVRHFGDREDPGEACGLCDVCAPEACVALTLRPPSAEDAVVAAGILEALRARSGVGSGTLCREVLADNPAERRRFDRLLSALARDGLVAVTDETFEKEGKPIAYRRVALTPAGRSAGQPQLSRLRLEADASPAAASRRRKPRSASLSKSEANADPDLLARLKTWRTEEARRRGVPPFLVLHDRTLRILAAERPRTLRALLALRGIGPAVAERYGDRLLALLA